MLLAGLLATCRDQVVNPPAPVSLTVTPISLQDSAATGSASRPAQSVTVASPGEAGVSWAAQRALRAAWLSLDHANGTTPTPVTLTFDPTGLAPGVYRDTVVFAPRVAAGAATRVPIEFHVYPCIVTPISLDAPVADSLRTADCGAPHGTGQLGRLYSFTASAGDSVSVFVSASTLGVVVALDTSLSPAAPVLAQSGTCPLAQQSACMLRRLLPQSGAAGDSEVSSATTTPRVLADTKTETESPAEAVKL